jgi:hypothetical protein
MSAAHEDTDNRDIRIGSLALQANLVTPEQIREALSIQAKEAVVGKMVRQIGLILVSRGHLTELQLSGLLQRQEELRRRK